MARRILIDDNARLLTLTGTAGVGKTRLALSLGCDLLHDDVFSNGVWLVDLSSAVDPEAAPSAIACALGLQESGGKSTDEHLVATMADHELLLILDNCEQVLDGCAQSCTTLLAASPGLRILATSRQPLAVS